MTMIKATYLGDLQVECEHLLSGTKIITNPPVDNNGNGVSFSPTDLCATSLAACMMTIMGMYAKNAEIDITGTEVEVTKQMKPDPRRIAEIEVVFNMPAKEYTDKDKKVLERAAHTCPVHFSLHPEMERKITFNWKD